MPTRTTALAILAIPAGVVGYLVTSAFVSGLALPEGARNAIILIVPLFISGVDHGGLLPADVRPHGEARPRRLPRRAGSRSPIDVADDADGERQPD